MKSLASRASITVVTLVSLACVSYPAIANAQDRYADREEAARYSVEIEPHFALGVEDVYGGTGYGAGLRVSIPFIEGHVGRLPDNLAFSFGGDILHYDDCYYASASCHANYLVLPAALQWNVFVARKVSVFGEGGLFVYKGWFDACGSVGDSRCNAPSDFGILPTFAIGVRIHVGDNVSFTARLGYPTTTLGLSFL
jgi:hypothetical protein